MQNLNHNVLESDHIGRLLIKLATPLLLGTFVMMVYNVVDTIFIGHYVGSLGLAGLSIVFPLWMLAMGIGMMVGMGGASLISRLIGSQDKAGAERALGNAIASGILLSVVMTIIVLPNIDFWIKLIGASENVMPFARDYLTLIIIGTVFNVLSNALVFWVRAEGNARVAMTTMIIAAGLNIILDAVFMIPLGMGMKGAALAIVIAQGIATVYALSFYVSKSSYLKLHLRNFAPDLRIVKLIFAIGIAQFSQTLAMGVASLFLIKMAANYGGDLALSSFGIIQRVLYFVMMPGMVLGQAMQPILGYNYGAKRWNLAIRTITLTIRTATSIYIPAFLIVYFLPEPIIRIFTSDPVLIEECTYVMRRVFISMPVIGFYAVGSQVFPSIGKAIESFIVAIVRPAVFLLPMVLILPRFLALDGVWYSFPASDGLTFLLVVALLIPLLRRFRRAASTETVVASQLSQDIPPVVD
jgi:putative MATE family efflux protein